MSRERLLKIDRACRLRVTVCRRRAKCYFAKDNRRLRDLTSQGQARPKSRRLVMLVFSIARNTDRSVERRLAIECEACGNITVVTRMRRCRDVAIDRRRRFRAYRVSQRRCFRQKPFRSDTELTSWIEPGTRIAGFGVLCRCVEYDFKSTCHSDTKSRQRISGERRTPDFGSILIVSGFDQDCGFCDHARTSDGRRAVETRKRLGRLKRCRIGEFVDGPKLARGRRKICVTCARNAFDGDERALRASRRRGKRWYDEHESDGKTEMTAADDCSPKQRCDAPTQRVSARSRYESRGLCEYGQNSQENTLPWLHLG